MSKTKTPRQLKCLTRGCTQPRRTRGLCSTCSRAAYRMIGNGEATEAELVEQGLLLENSRPQPGLFRKRAQAS